MSNDEKLIYQREYMREWRKKPAAKKYHREYMKKWRTENPDKIKECQKKSDKKRRARKNEWKKKWKQAHPFITKSRMILTHAVEDGKIIKPDECSKCNSNGKIDGHHPDYSEPLKVMWLCQNCHRTLHLEGCR